MKTKLAAFCQSHGFQCSQNCFAVEESRLSQFPTLKLMLGKVSTNWYPPSYLYPASVPSQKRTYCFGFDDNGSHGGSVLGATWMVDHEIVFDIKKKRIGVADLSCPVYKTRPKAPKPSDFETEMPTAAPQTNATDMTAPPNAEPDDTQTTSKPADTQTPPSSPSMPPLEPVESSEMYRPVNVVSNFACTVSLLVAVFLFALSAWNLCYWQRRRGNSYQSTELQPV